MSEDTEAIVKRGVKTPVGFKDRQEEISKSNKAALNKLYCVAFVSLFFIAAQVTGGILSNSIAIFTDTAHLASDLIGFMISIISLYTAQKPATKTLSFGYHRAEVLGTLVSIMFLWALTIWLLVEATKRFVNAPEIGGTIMLITAVAGLFFNLIQIKILHGGEGHYHLGGGHDHDHGEEGGCGHDHADHKHDHAAVDNDDVKKPLTEGEKEHTHDHDHEGHDHDHKDDGENHAGTGTNINVTSAYLHVLGDMLMSVGVIIAATIINIWPSATIADPLCTYFFSVLICFTTIPVFKDCILVLMESTPMTIDSDKVFDDICNTDGVEEVHDFHLWSVSVGKYSLSCHISSHDQLKTLSKVTDLIRRKFKLYHTTIQMEGVGEHEHAFKCANDLHE
jgi:zinc transporter 2